MIYLTFIIIFSIVLIVSIILFIYFNNDEKHLKEVSTSKLTSLGKVYTKEEFEDSLFNQYSNIITNTTYENYNFLKDSVSDSEYNQILLILKNSKDNNETNVISNIKKEFSKLISFEVKDDLEIAKLWVKYSDIEYTKGIRKIVNEDNKEELVERIVKGSDSDIINHEYILTFVKNRTQSEDTICPSCGYQSHILLSSNCVRCDSVIVPKKMHWVYIGKVNTNISK